MGDERTMIAYVAGPYRGKTEIEVRHNIDRAANVAEILWIGGFAVVCPHLNSAFFGGCISDEQFIARYIEIMNRCDCVVMGYGSVASDGAWRERTAAIAAGIPVFEWPADALDWLREGNRKEVEK
jgi:hypothetical protein